MYLVGLMLGSVPVQLERYSVADWMPVLDAEHFPHKMNRKNQRRSPIFPSRRKGQEVAKGRTKLSGRFEARACRMEPQQHIAQKSGM